MKNIILISTFSVISACATVPEVQSSDTSDALNTVTITCKSPYVLSQDCNNWIGASRTISVEGFDVKVGATSDGSTILVMDAKPLANILFSNPLLLNSPKHSKASNNSFDAVKKVLGQNAIKIKRVRPLKSFGNIDGYVLELPQDGYSILKQYTAEKS